MCGQLTGMCGITIPQLDLFHALMGQVFVAEALGHLQSTGILH